MKRVLIYTNYWKKGGIEKLIMYFIEHLSSDFKFVILTEDVPDPEEQFKLPLNVDIYFNNFTPFNEINLNRLRDLVLRIDPDLVIAMGSNRSLYKMPRALVGLDYPVVISEHNSYKELIRSFSHQPLFLNALRNISDIHHVIFSDFISDYKVQEKVRVIPNPIPELKRTCSYDERENTIVCIGRFHLHQKQQDILVKAFSLIALRYPDWKLKLYGGDWFGGKQRIMNLANEFNISTQVFIFDSTDDIESVLSKAKIFAMPSAYEGFGLVAGEALSLGVPVIAYESCDGVNQIVKHNYNGLLVPGSVKNEKEFSKYLENLIVDADLRDKFTYNSKESINEYSMDSFIGKWKSLMLEGIALKGDNKLKNLTLIEKDYIELIVSGLLFDKGSSGKGKKSLKIKIKIEVKKILIKFGLFTKLKKFKIL